MSTADHDPTTSLTDRNPHHLAAPLTPPAIPAEGPHIITEADDTHLMYLDGFLIGVAHTYEDAQATLAEAIDEIALQTRATTADMAAEAAALRLEHTA
jgi:hypothetical protein